MAFACGGGCGSRGSEGERHVARLCQLRDSCESVWAEEVVAIARDGVRQKIEIDNFLGVPTVYFEGRSYLVDRLGCVRWCSGNN